MSRLLDRLRFRLRAAFRPKAMERELDEEFAFHLEMEARKLVERGLPAEEAAREARRRFGGMAAQQQAARDSWGVEAVRDFGVDLRHALRQFRRRPGFSSLGIVTLALGLGATVGLVGVVTALLLRPLPVADEANLRVFWDEQDWRGVEFDYLKERIRAFSGLAAYGSDGVVYRGESSSAVVLVGKTSAGLFDVLGVHAALGRTFVVGEDRPGAERVVVVSDGFWRQDLGADPGVVGRRITLDGQPTTVIGVMPRGFFFPTPEHRLWQPLDLDPASGAYQGNGWLVLVGRVRPGTSEQQIGDELQRLAQSLGERFHYPAAWDKTKGATARPLRQALVGEVRPALLLLLGAGVLILLMACANVAALVLARTTDRGQEMVLRAALGAGRGRLARQIVTESLALSVTAGVLGSAIAAFGFRILVSRLPLPNGLAEATTLDWTTFLVALGLAVVVGLGVALAPVRDLLAGRISGLTQSRGVRGLGRGHGRIHAALVTTETAVAVLLVVGALLLVRSVARLVALDLGFDGRGVVAVELAAIDAGITPTDRWRFFRAIGERARTIPGVSRVGMIPRLPIRDGGWQGPVDVVGKPELEGAKAPNALYRVITPGLFEALGMKMVRGRGFDGTDRAGTVRVGVVSEAFATRAWPGEEPIGQRLRTGVTYDTTAITVVGVVRDIKAVSITGSNPPVLYVPMEQAVTPPDGQVLVLKSGPPGAVIAAVRAMAHEIDPRVAVGRATTMDEAVTVALAEPLQLRFFLTLFGGLAILLGIVGVYSVVSYSVTRRQTEFGVRMALGAAPGRVVVEVLRRGIAPVALGTALGAAAAVALARVGARFLFEISPTDPASLVLASATLLGAGIAAASVPAWRASRGSPVTALRSE